MAYPVVSGSPRCCDSAGRRLNLGLMQGYQSVSLSALAAGDGREHSRFSNPYATGT